MTLEEHLKADRYMDFPLASQNYPLQFQTRKIFLIPKPCLDSWNMQSESAADATNASPELASYRFTENVPDAWSG